MAEGSYDIRASVSSSCWAAVEFGDAWSGPRAGGEDGGDGVSALGTRSCCCVSCSTRSASELERSRGDAVRWSGSASYSVSSGDSAGRWGWSRSWVDVGRGGGLPDQAETPRSSSALTLRGRGLPSVPASPSSSSDPSPFQTVPSSAPNMRSTVRGESVSSSSSARDVDAQGRGRGDSSGVRGGLIDMSERRLTVGLRSR